MVMSGADVVVIGGTRGVGRLVALLLHHRGARVRVLARHPIPAAARLGTAVDVIGGDLTKEETLLPAVEGAGHIVLTAGVRSGRPASEQLVKAAEYDGVLNVLAAAQRTSFKGRFLYMTASGVMARSLGTTLLNLWKGNTLKWRWRVEDRIRNSGVNYTIIRAGILTNGPGGRPVEVTQTALPLAWRYRIARADVAEAFVAALHHPLTSRATFEVVGAPGSPGHDWNVLFGRLRPDASPSTLIRPRL